MRSILFVCLGNICRSPVAAAVARTEFARAGLTIDVASAGTGDYHAGQGADARAIASAAAHGYDVSAHRAHQIVSADFGRYDALLAMDHANLRALVAQCPPRHSGKLGLFLPFAGIEWPDEVPDPYFGEAQGFERVVDLVRDGARGLIEKYRNGA
jgi:protein-tyrosine phosphatase